jgi:DNA polymerase-3 subunit delta
MFYILHGKDDFSLNKDLEGLIASLGDPQMLAVNTVRLDGQHLTLSELKDNCNAVPFLAPNRLVIVEGLLKCFEPKWGKQRSGKRDISKARNGLERWEGLVPYIEQMPQTTILMLVDGEIKNNNSLLKKVSSVAKIKTFPLLGGSNLTAWIRKRMVEEGGSITPQAVSLLAELVGGNLWVMNNEIQKLVLYTRGGQVTEDDVRQVVSSAQETNIFTLVDAVVEGRAGVAQRMLHRLLQEGMPPGQILAMITRQFRLIAQTMDLSTGLSRKQIQDRLGLTGYPLDKTLRQSELYDLEHIKRTYARLLETDLAIKTGKYNDQLALELLLAELSTC